MAFTYDAATEAGQVRLLIGDVDVSDATRQVYTDAEIGAFIALGGTPTNVFSAAAMALRAIAGNEIQTLKVIKSLDLETDGAKTGEALLKVAASYDERAEMLAAGDAGFDVAEFANDPWTYREKTIKELLRSGV